MSYLKKFEQLSEHDRAELERFKQYLRACAKWDNANDELPDFAPIGDFEAMTYEKKRLKAHATIYTEIYGEKL